MVNCNERNTVFQIYTYHAIFFFQCFFHGHWQLTGQQQKGVDHLLFHSATSTRSQTFRHLFATLYVRWLSVIFLIALFVFTRLLLDEIYHLIELPFDWLMKWWYFLFVYLRFDYSFCYRNLTQETGGLELASTITFVLQANRLSVSLALQFRTGNIQERFHIKLQDLTVVINRFL